MPVISFETTPQGAPTVGRPCDRCGSDTRLFGLEPHPSVEQTDLRTYVCETCGGVQTEIIPLPR